VSPALPIGGFAYSQGLEQAVAAGWVRDEEQAARWIGGLLEGSIARLDLPVVARLHAAFAAGDDDAVRTWNAFLLAARPTAELQAEDRHLGAALARLLAGLDVPGAAAWAKRTDVAHAAMFALAASHWDLPPIIACTGFAFSWAEAQVSAAVRLIPLGQTAGQRILVGLAEAIPAAAVRALEVADDDVGAVAPGQSIASARHETQYSRLFRS
jgi:urease accessory protein